MITLKEIEHLAELARLELTEAEKTQYQKELAPILAYVEKIQKLNEKTDLNVEAVKPTDFRIDKIENRPKEETKQIIVNFPEKEGNLNKVKAVFE